jgi:hypothetical protein
VREKKVEGEKSKDGLKGRVEGEKKEEEVGEGGVRVGSVLVRVGGSRKKGGDVESVEKPVDRGVGKVGRQANTGKLNGQTMLLRKYTSCEEDLR